MVAIHLHPTPSQGPTGQYLHTTMYLYSMHHTAFTFQMVQLLIQLTLLWHQYYWITAWLQITTDNQSGSKMTRTPHTYNTFWTRTGSTACRSFLLCWKVVIHTKHSSNYCVSDGKQLHKKYFLGWISTGNIYCLITTYLRTGLRTERICPNDALPTNSLIQVSAKVGGSARSSCGGSGVSASFTWYLQAQHSSWVVKCT